MHVGPVFFLHTFALLQASVGAGAGVVRHEGGASFSALSVTPAVQRLSPSLYLGAGGSISLLTEGALATQANGEIWAAFARARWGDTQGAINATIAASSRSDGIGAGAGAALVELVSSKSRGGVGFGVGSAGGVIEGAPSVAALRVRARSWWQQREVGPQFSFIIEGTRFAGAWYTDFVGGLTLERPRLVVSLWVMARASATYGSTGAASGTLQYFLSPGIALEASGGSYLRDPFQGLPRAGFGGAGIRVYVKNRSVTPATSPPQLRPVIAQRRDGDTVVVRFRMEGASTVAIAGSWNDWKPAVLRGVGNDLWEAELRLPAGTYYFNLLVDGQEWVVPGGTAVVPDGMGGLVAVLTVL
jgi:hypothetical protein